MKHIDLIKGANEAGEPTISPAEPFPADAIAIVCDGKSYIVYQPGDELPPPPVTETTEAA